jgi:branched-chain amino acid transport system substrate-binding protein
LTDEGPEGFFTAHAVDCVNLITLATIVAGSDDPARIKAKVGEVASGGRVCTSFDSCVSLLDQDLQIDYNGYSGSVDLSNSAGDPTRAWFESFGFDDDGIETGDRVFEVP